MKRIGAITMVRNDNFFLKKWILYYGSLLGNENLYILFDGSDQAIPDYCPDVNMEILDRTESGRSSSDKKRIRIISSRANSLLKSGYDIIIGSDVDEFLTVDPLTGKTLSEYLSGVRIDLSLSALGLDVGQKIDKEGDLGPDAPFLSQRHYARISSRYTKVSVIAGKCEWGSGFHRLKGHNYHIDPNLYLLHFGYSDLKMLESKFADSDRLKQGWDSHMKKRARTIKYTTEKKAGDFDNQARKARLIATIFRPPYAWNKPSLLEKIIIVRLPERFRSIL